VHRDWLAMQHDAGSLTGTKPVPPSARFAARVDERGEYRSGSGAWSMSCPLDEPASGNGFTERAGPGNLTPNVGTSAPI